MWNRQSLSPSAPAIINFLSPSHLINTMPNLIRLFIKPGCPWCDEAIDWLHSHNIPFVIADVINDRAAWEEMKELTGQTKAPCIDVDGEFLADFGADELEVWWKKKGYPGA